MTFEEVAVLEKGRTMTDDELKRLDALCAAASPEPWNLLKGEPRGVFEGSNWICELFGEKPEQDAQFIAAARSALPAAITEIKTLRALISVVERGSPNQPYLCPFCQADRDVPLTTRVPNEPHRDDCPAFTPTGEVK